MVEKPLGEGVGATPVPLVSKELKINQSDTTNQIPGTYAPFGLFPGFSEVFRA